MADRKKQTKAGSRKTGRAQKAQAGKQQAQKPQAQKAQPPEKRMIYRHHRTFVGGGLVGLIILAFLVGTEIIPLQPPGFGGTGNTDIKVLKPQTDPDRPSQSVVARNGDGSNAQITIHEGPLAQDAPEAEQNGQSAPEAPRQMDYQDNLRQSLDKLQKITQGQQQMIRMLAQKHEQHRQTMTEQIRNLSLQVTNALESDEPTMLKLNNSVTLLQLRQDNLFFQNQWQQGLLSAENLMQWQAYVSAQGYPEAAEVAAELAESLETFGALNRQALRQTALSVSAGERLADRQQPETHQQSADNATEQGWWDKLQSRLAGLVTIRRIEGDTPETAGRPDPVLRAELTSLLADGDMAGFWQLMLDGETLENEDPVVARLRLLVDAHMTQMNGFQQIYQALTAARRDK